MPYYRGLTIGMRKRMSNHWQLKMNVSVRGPGQRLQQAR